MILCGCGTTVCRASAWGVTAIMREQNDRPSFNSSYAPCDRYVMTPEEWWKNFALGMEIDAAGTFIYNGIRSLHELPTLNHPVDSFEVLYNLSVGLERLLKVAIILIEHTDQIDIEQFEESLISHSTIDLANRIDAQRSLALADVHREFLSLLSKFYKSHRYGRYSLSAVPNISQEKLEFLQFLAKHLKVQFDLESEFTSIQNTNQIRKFVGKVVKKICDEVFAVVGRRALELNIYTNEIRGDSKALKVFYGKRLDFLDENIKKKELLHYLMSEKASGDHVELLRSVEALDLDPAMVPNYMQALLNEVYLPYIEGEIDELYTEVVNVRERLGFMSIIDNEYLSYGGEDEV